MSNKIVDELNQIEIPSELSTRSRLGVAKAKSETQSGKRKWYIFALPALAAALALSFAGLELLPGTSESPVIKTVEYSNSFDVSDPNKLVGWADSVFIGKVVEQSGSKSLDGFPETQFKVEVLQSIKGDLNGTITVNQQGGYEGNQLTLIENDSLLEEGKSYLLVTKYLKHENWHTLVPVYGDIEIQNEDHKAKLINKYRKAFEEQVPFE